MKSIKPLFYILHLTFSTTTLFPNDTTITSDDITWIINGTPNHGNYINGDPWVVGPITITKITPEPADNRNGSVVNPRLGSEQGFDIRLNDTNPYAHFLNIGESLPHTIQINSSLISSISNTSDSKYTQISSFSILTIVESAPPPNSFRPSYQSGDYTNHITLDQIDLSPFRNLENPTKIIYQPNIDNLISNFSRIWYEQDLTWTGRRLHTPYQSENGYGKNMAIKTGDALLLLHLNYSIEKKMELAIQIIQYGIDIFGIMQSGGAWNADGGHNNGRLAPLLCAAVSLDNKQLKSALSEKLFQEVQQTFYVSQDDINICPKYSSDNRRRTCFTSTDLNKPEWGEKHTKRPDKDGNNWDIYYRNIAGGTLQALCASAELLNARQLINHDALFDYAKRHIYYRNGKFSSVEYYNGYDDNHNYGDGDTITREPFRGNETSQFHNDFYMKYIDKNQPNTPTGLILSN